jgi:hypothetical protein
MHWSHHDPHSSLHSTLDMEVEVRTGDDGMEVKAGGLYRAQVVLSLGGGGRWLCSRSCAGEDELRGEKRKEKKKKKK